MINRYPDVPVGEELLDVARAVFSNPLERIAIDDDYPQKPFAWHSPEGYDPPLKILAPKLFRPTRMRIDHAVMVVIEDGDASELAVNLDIVSTLEPDPYTLSFVEAFRQYKPHQLVINVSERHSIMPYIGGQQ